MFDTGVNADHVDLAGRVNVKVPGWSAFDDAVGAGDCQGHGTHCAGTIAGTLYGVAKKASIVSVRVLGCDGSGSTAGIIGGIDWMTEQVKSGSVEGPVVGSMSLGGGVSAAQNAAVASAVEAGITVVVAAGNDNG